MKKLKVCFVISVFLMLLIQGVKGQSLLSESELKTLLDKAEVQAQNYIKVFQNLSAEELKTKLYYKKNGRLNNKRVIKSIFIVYQSPNSEYAQEFRNVIEFNGKNVQRSDNKIAKFFNKLSKVDSTNAEYEKIKKEGLRYDGRTITWGMTLSITRPFSNKLRNDFSFRVIGREKIDGADVWKIDYEQVRKSPYIYSNPTEEEQIERKKMNTGGTLYSTAVSGAFRPTNPLMKGTIWLNVENAQIRQNDFQIVFHPTKLSKPVTAIEFSYQYQDSDFEVLVPKSFTIRAFRIIGENEKNLSVTKDSEIIFDYSKFKEFKTNIDKYEIK